MKAFHRTPAMSASHTIFESYSRPSSLDFSDDLQALPSVGSVWARFRTAFSNWTQAAMQAHAESRLWDSAQADPRIMSELELSRVGPELEEAAPFETSVRLTLPPDNKPLNDGWGGILEHAYQTRFHSNGAQFA
jgi:hypothetical protein